MRPDAPAEQQRWEPRRRTPRTGTRTCPIKLDVSEEISSLRAVSCHRPRHLLFAAAAAAGSFRDSGTHLARYKEMMAPTTPLVE